MTTALFFKILMWLTWATALIFAITYWKYYKNTKQRYFLHLLVLIFATEIMSTVQKDYFEAPNYFYYNILSFITQLFYLIWFYKVSDKNLVLKSGILVYVLIAICSVFFEPFFHGLNKTLWFSGAIIILFNATYYFYLLLKENEIIHFLKDQTFWITTGLLIYHIGYLPLLFFLEIDLFKSDTLYYRIPVLLLNIVLYGCFSKSFTCSKILMT